jgi:TusA-related sulfurtransferase
VVAVKYIATDSAGNRAEASGRLRIASGEEPWVYVNGEQIDRDASAILKSGDGCTVKVDAGGRPYRIMIKEGVKTVAQMKIGSTTITDYTATTEEISLPQLKSGTYYTLCVLTQDRDYFRIIIYVE